MMGKPDQGACSIQRLFASTLKRRSGVACKLQALLVVYFVVVVVL